MRILYVTGIVVLLDQVTKLLVKGFELPFFDLYHRGVPIGASYPILGDFVRLTFIENPGMAFGIDVGGKLFLTVFSIAATGGIFIYLYRIREEAWVIRFSLAMILGGAIGNLIDRVFYGVVFGEGALFYGKVVDFIDIDFFNVEMLGYHMSRWPVFNFADASVSIGVVLLLIFHRKFTEAGEPRLSLATSTLAGSVSDGMKNGPPEAPPDSANSSRLPT